MFVFQKGLGRYNNDDDDDDDNDDIVVAVGLI